MRISSVKIEGLFDLFSYDISFDKNENVLLITGPNGFGKTMILNVIFNIFNKRFHFFQKLVFSEIVIQLDEDIIIRIEKDNSNNTTFSFFNNVKLIEKFKYSAKIETDNERFFERFLPVLRVSNDLWIEKKTDKLLNYDDLVNDYFEHFPEDIQKNIFRLGPEAGVILNSIQVHLIREQRLFKKATVSERNYRESKDQTIMIETIQTYANELKEHISNNIQKSFNQTQALDSSYLDRLIDEINIISEEDYNSRLTELNEKQEKLIGFGLYESKQKIRSYSEKDAKALLVYINDLEKKLLVFDDLLRKLELFTNILNERRFTFKSIKISREKGFFFKTEKGKELDLNQLSSGEQHEVVLLYELIFNVKPNILVLIDEPEISLHITWQKEFLNDLLKIIELQKAQVVVATHAPAIINGRWDLVYNLSKSEIE